MPLLNQSPRYFARSLSKAKPISIQVAVDGRARFRAYLLRRSSVRNTLTTPTSSNSCKEASGGSLRKRATMGRISSMEAFSGSFRKSVTFFLPALYFRMDSLCAGVNSSTVAGLDPFDLTLLLQAENKQQKNKEVRIANLIAILPFQNHTTKDRPVLPESRVFSNS